MSKNMMERRVVVTGLGVVAPTGIGKNSFWENIEAGRSGIKKIKRFDTSELSVKSGGEVSDFEPTKFFSEEEIFATTRSSQFAIFAAKEALKDASLDLKSFSSEKICVSLGTTTGGLDFVLSQHPYFLNREIEKIHPFTFSKTIPNAATSLISIYFGIIGPSRTFCSACAASTDAIGYGFRTIKTGEVDLAIVGGAETPLHPFILTTCWIGKILSSGANSCPDKFPRPFDAKRDGTVIGEGAGILILEDLESALKRKANIYAEIAGFGYTSDAHHMVRPLSTGEEASRAILKALEEANLKPENIDYINAHGTGTIKNDKVEVQIIKKVFRDYVYKLYISSTKSMTGHLFGAAGAVESVICCLAVNKGIIPPTINYSDKDPECDLNFVPNTSIKKSIDAVLNNSFGFGGENSVLIFKKLKE